MEAIRGGLSGRGEFWNMPDTAIDAANILRTARAKLAADKRQFLAEGGVSAAIGYVPFGGLLGGKIVLGSLSRMVVNPFTVSAAKRFGGYSAGEYMLGKVVSSRLGRMVNAKAAAKFVSHNVQAVSQDVAGSFSSELAGRSVGQYALGRAMASNIGKKLYVKQAARIATRPVVQKFASHAATGALAFGKVAGVTYGISMITSPVMSAVGKGASKAVDVLSPDRYSALTSFITNDNEEDKKKY
jgi:hypothetical protein